MKLKNYRHLSRWTIAWQLQNFTIKVWLLKPGHLEEDYPITTFFENKLCNHQKLQNRWTYLTSQETTLKFMNVIGLLAIKEQVVAL